jgi:hypothetical protein
MVVRLNGPFLEINVIISGLPVIRPQILGRPPYERFLVELFLYWSQQVGAAFDYATPPGAPC